MKNKISLHECIQESLTEGLLKLLKCKALTEISITELCRTAGVSRSSFYRCYSSKEEILLEYLESLYQDFFNEQIIPEKIDKQTNINSFLYPRFSFIKSHQDFFIMLSKNNLLLSAFNKMDKELLWKIGGQTFPPDDYYQAYVSGAIAGVVEYWAKNCFKESEEELVKIFEFPFRQFFQ